MAAIRVNRFDGKTWDQFVYSHTYSTFFHLSGWGKCLEKTFGLRAFYLTAEDDSGKIEGVLPLFLKKGFPSGKALISVPIGVYGGILAEDEEAERRLLEKAVELTKELDCDYLELRHKKEVKLDFPEMPLINKELYCTFIKALPAGVEDCLASLPRKARQAVNKSIRSGLVFERGPGLLDECYDTYALSQRDLGSPVVTRKWFQSLVEEFGEAVNTSRVRYGDKTLCSLLSFFFKGTVMPFYEGDVRGYEKHNPNNYIYLKLQEKAVEEGCRYFDFGRSRENTGTYSFKINQGFEPEQLYYQYFLNKSPEVPNVSPSNKSFELAKNIWKHLPLPVTKWLGPGLFKKVMP